MTTLHFVRHGQTDWNAIRRVQGSSESTLTELGESQAADLRKLWNGKSFDTVYSSDLRRTRQTTDILLDGNTADVIYSEQLREIHLGPWEGMMLDDIMTRYPQQADHFRNAPSQFSLQDAESFHQLQQRAHHAIEQIVRDCAGQQVLIVSHGALIKSLLIDYDGWPLDNLWQPPEMPNCGHSIVLMDNPATPIIKQFGNQTDWQPMR